MLVLTLLRNYIHNIFFSTFLTFFVFFNFFFLSQLVFVTFFGVVSLFWSMGNFQTVDKIFWFIWWIPEMIDTMFYKYVYNYNNNNQEIVRQLTFKEEWENSISYWIVFTCILLLIWSILSVVCWIALKFAVSCFL